LGGEFKLRRCQKTKHVEPGKGHAANHAANETQISPSGKPACRGKPRS
jgi:hypothetical protein